MTEPREEMWGDRYGGFVASILEDLEHAEVWWEVGLAFMSIGEPPPFEWAGRKETP